MDFGHRDRWPQYTEEKTFGKIVQRKKYNESSTDCILFDPKQPDLGVSSNP